MKKLFLLSILSISFFACSDSSSESASVTATPVNEFVKPVANFLNANEGVQLFSFFDDPSYNGEIVTLSGTARTTGSSGSNKVIFIKSFDVDGITFEPFVVVSEEEKTKIADQLKRQEAEGNENGVDIIFEGKLTKEGSMKSPFGGEIKLKFDQGKIIQ